MDKPHVVSCYSLTLLYRFFCSCAFLHRNLHYVRGIYVLAIKSLLNGCRPDSSRLQHAYLGSIKSAEDRRDVFSAIIILNLCLSLSGFSLSCSALQTPLFLFRLFHFLISFIFSPPSSQSLVLI